MSFRERVREPIYGAQRGGGSQSPTELPRRWRYHAHVLASTRKLRQDGFGDKAAIALSDASARAWVVRQRRGRSKGKDGPEIGD